MKVDYWVLRLKTSRFIKIILAARRNNIAELTYIEVTKPAAILVKWCRKLKIPTPVLHKIKPRESVAGPILHLSKVRNDKGEVISLDVYHRILELRREIMERFLDSFREFTFIKSKRPLNTLSAYIGMLVAIDIRAAVYLAYFARWKNYKKGEKEKTKNVLIIPKSDWGNFLAENFEKVVDRVIVEKNGKAGFMRQCRVIKNLLRSLFKAGLINSFKQVGKSAAFQSHRTYDHTQGKIMVTYAMGLIEGQRNDFPFYHAAKIDPARILIYFMIDKYLPTGAELDWIKKNKITCIAAPSMQTTIPGIIKWTPSRFLKNEMKEFSQLYIKTFIECLKSRKNHSLWLLNKLWDMGKGVTYWKDFYTQNKVSILVNPNPSEDNFIPDLAISEIGGLVVEAERSIRFDYCTYIHNSPTHVSFITGPYSLTQTPEPSFSLFTLQTGALNVINSFPTARGVESLKKQGKIIVAVFDESGNDVFFGDSITQLYRAVIDLVNEDDRFVLYVKTKKTNVLEKFADVGSEIRELEKKGQCVLADWKVSAAAAASFSDLVVSVPSTAAFESVITGARTIVFNPMRCGSRLFYTNNGLNRRVFEESKPMVAAIKKYADGENHSLGDCSDIVPRIDPFRDGAGAKRIGEYLKWCLEGFDSKLQWQDVIQRANNRYMEMFGSDKKTGENCYEEKYKAN